MGYTHYWTFTKTDKAQVLETKYQKAILECQKVVQSLAAHNRKRYGSTLLSGYTAHSKVGQYAGLQINGAGDDACECFVMREHFSQNDARNFCKTGQGYYDFVVVACLAVLQYRLGDAISVCSDGTEDEWAEAVAYAGKILRRKIPVPAGVRARNTNTAI